MDVFARVTSSMCVKPCIEFSLLFFKKIYLYILFPFFVLADRSVPTVVQTKPSPSNFWASGRVGIAQCVVPVCGSHLPWGWGKTFNIERVKGGNRALLSPPPPSAKSMAWSLKTWKVERVPWANSPLACTLFFDNHCRQPWSPHLDCRSHLLFDAGLLLPPKWQWLLQLNGLAHAGKKAVFCGHL